MGNFVQPAIAVGLGVATGGLSTAVGLAFYASAAVGAVGAVTKNEDLQKLGTLIGLGAGIYGAATGAFAGEVAGEAAADAAIDSTVAEAAAESAGGSLSQEAINTVSGSAIAPSNTALAGVDHGNTTNIAAKANANAGTGVATAPAPASAPPVPAAPPGGTPPPGGFFDKILSNPQSMYGAGLIAQGVGPIIAGGFAGGTEEEKLEFLRQQEEAKQAELDRRVGNFSNIPSVNLGIKPSGQRLHRAPRPLINPYRSPVLPN